MLSYANSYKVDLTNSKLPLLDLVLAHVSISERDYDAFLLNLSSLLPQAQVISTVKMVLTPEEVVAREFEWLDIEIYIPKTDVNRIYSGMGNIPQLLSQVVAGTNPHIALLEIINLTNDIVPVYYRREFGDLTILPFPADYEFVFKGVADLKRTPDDNILIYRAYTGADWLVKSVFNADLSETDTTYRPSESPIMVIGMHTSGMWVSGSSIQEVGNLANMPALKNPSVTLNSIMENIWKLNPELQEEDDYQVYHRALHAYKIAYDKVTPAVMLSILTHPQHYKGLAEFLITAPNPPAPNLRSYIAEHVKLEEGRYGVTDKELTEQAPGEN